MKSQTKYKVIGLMSGTSLDGIDIAFCEFSPKEKWNFKLLKGQTIGYSEQWRRHLSSAHLLSGEQLIELDNRYGTYLGKVCADFLKKNNIRKIDLIASHGHTVFHQPQKRFTYQLGSGNALHAQTGIPVISDFRSLDVLQGGEGAPLVPVGDQLLFHRYDVCLNIGGIANLSRIQNKKRIAFDICFANMGLNYLSTKIGLTFDKNGKQASIGIVIPEFVKAIEKCYAKWRKTRPSLAREGFEELIQPVLDWDQFTVVDRLRSFTETICNEIERCIPASEKKQKMLVTGGGAMNTFLMKSLAAKMGSSIDIVIPETSVIKFKEAIVFGLLGVLRFRGETNVFKSVTGASEDSSSGVMIGF